MCSPKSRTLAFVLLVSTVSMFSVQIGQAQCDVYIDPGHGGVAGLYDSGSANQNNGRCTGASALRRLSLYLQL